MNLVGVSVDWLHALMHQSEENMRTWLYIRSTIISLTIFAVAACGGGGGDTPPSSTSSATPTTVVGVAATGAPIVGTVTLKDVAGVTRTVATSATGAFSLNISGLTPPFFLLAADTLGTVTLYSIAPAPGIANINPLSHLVVVSAAMNVDTTITNPFDIFADPAKFKSITAAQVGDATTMVMGKMSTGFRAMLGAQGALNVNPITDLYAIGNGLDKTFDAFTLTLNPVTGTITEKDTSTGVVSIVATQPELRLIHTPHS